MGSRFLELQLVLKELLRLLSGTSTILQPLPHLLPDYAIECDRKMSFKNTLGYEKDINPKE